MFTSSTKRENRKFHVVVAQRRQRNVQKKCDARAELLFCQSKPIVFLSFLSLSSSSSLLKLPSESLTWSRVESEKSKLTINLGNKKSMAKVSFEIEKSKSNIDF